MAKKRSKNLDDEDIKTIVEILDGWSGKLTWESLIAEIELRLKNRYTRQALSKHARIQNAYLLQKNGLSDSDQRKKAVSPELQIALDKNARLEAENRRLESENEQLLEQFARWAYNAHTRGLSHDFLNRPLPEVNRGKTKQPDK